MTWNRTLLCLLEISTEEGGGSKESTMGQQGGQGRIQGGGGGTFATP